MSRIPKWVTNKIPNWIVKLIPKMVLPDSGETISLGMVQYERTTQDKDETTEVGDVDAILKMHDQALVTGDIEAGQVVVCVFDGTNWQMTSQLAQ